VRIKCFRCGRRREEAYLIRLEAWIPDVGGYEDFRQEDAGVCAQCKQELMLPKSVGLLLRRALNGGAK
jgi:hypothetical protein